MYQAELQKLEGVWTGTEEVDIDGARYAATGRWEFHTVFDGKFLLADYVQTAVDKPTSVGHGVFCKDAKTDALTVTWFRIPGSTKTQQSVAVSEGDRLVFIETIDEVSTRSTYAVVLNRLSVVVERSTKGDDWKRVFEGTYKRPRG